MNRHALTTSLTATALALGGLLAVTGGAAAYSAPASSGIAPASKPYTGEDTVQNFGPPGTVVTFNFLAGTGGTTPSRAIVNFAGATQSVAVAADGAVAFSVVVPENAVAGSEITGFATVGSTEVPFVVEVAGAPVVELAAVTTPAPTDPSVVLWFGMGALALAGAAVVVGTITRRARSQA